MLEELKAVVVKSRHHLDDLVDKIEDQSEDLSEGALELWQEAKPKLQALKDSLVTAEKSLHTQTDEARLQTHLAIMDARDQWSYLSKTVTELARETQKKGQIELQQAELKAHLAKMDGRDFLNTTGAQVKRDFKQVRNTLEQTSHKAAKDLEESLETIGNVWPSIIP